MTSLRVAAVCALVLFVGGGAALAAEEWKVIDKTDEGYEIASREVAGQEVPTMRGRGVLNADVLQVLAVLLDAPRTKEWAEGATWTKVLEQQGILATLLHTYSDLKWPVSDRDAITRAKLIVLKPGEAYELAMTAEPNALPEMDGVVRIKRSDVHFVLKKQGEGKVWVEYMVDADPGGRLPKWLIRWASKSIPGDTLRKLQERAVKTQGQYAKVITQIQALPSGAQ